jgi:hypothetical protein
MITHNLNVLIKPSAKIAGVSATPKLFVSLFASIMRFSVGLSNLDAITVVVFIFKPIKLNRPQRSEL